MKRIDVEITDFVDARFEEYAKSRKRSKRAQLAWMIEEALKKEGMLAEGYKEKETKIERELAKKDQKEKIRQSSK